MDLSTPNLSAELFRELSHLSDGDFVIYLCNDPSNFSEIHRTGDCYSFTTTLSAFIPEVVIKLHSPLVSSMVTAIPTHQGSITLLTRTFDVVENLPNIVNLTMHRNAAFIAPTQREDTSLAVWADEVEPALASLRQVLDELGVNVAVDVSGLEGLVLDSSDIDNEDTAGANLDRPAFDDFMYHYEDPSAEPHDYPMLAQTLFPAEPMAAMDTAERTNTFGSPPPNSLALVGPTSLCPAALSGISGQSLSVDSVDLSVTSPFSPGRELMADNPRKRKHPIKMKQTLSKEKDVPEENLSRRASRVPTTKEAGSPPRAPPNSPSAGQSRLPSPISTVPLSITPKTLETSGLNKTRTPAAQLNAPLVAQAASHESESEYEHEILESDDSGTEYEPEASELEHEDDDSEDDDEDNDHRPAKRTRSLSEPTWATAPSTSVTTQRKGTSPKISLKTTSKKKKSSAGRGKKKPRSKSVGPPPMCVWCEREFSRESDVLRHEQRSCKLYPFDREHKCCPLCDKEFSRNDAVVRHQGSEDCQKRQRERGPL